MSKLSTCLYHANSATKLRRKAWTSRHPIYKTLSLCELTRADMDAEDWEVIQEGEPVWGWHSPKDGL